MKRVLATPLVVMIAGIAACGGSPTAASPPPTPTPTPLPVVLAQFADPQSGQMTSDVYDVDNQVVQFDIANRTLIWRADGRTFTGYIVNGNIINVDFQVRFGTDKGVWHAYFTETARPFICNIEIVNGQLSITATNVPVPNGQPDTP